MNINAKIDWRNGLELTSQTFVTLDNSIDQRLLSVERIVNGNLFGILPFAKFNNSAIFVKKQIEFERLQCTALLPSGRFIEIDDRVAIDIPMLYGDTYYVTAALGKKRESFALKNVDMVKPDVVYGVHTLEELSQGDMIPVLKLLVKDGIFSIDGSYMAPFLQIDSSKEYGEFIDMLSVSLKQLAEHPNLESGEAARTLTRYIFLLKSYRPDSKVRDFISFTEEIMQAIEYYIMQPNGGGMAEAIRGNEYDVMQWLSLYKEYLKGVVTILDKVVLEDKTIDLEKLKAELKEEIYLDVYANLYATLKTELESKMRNEIKVEITDKLEEYINGEFKRKVKEQLQIELTDKLTIALFDDLFKKLYDALYVKEETEEDKFMPLI